MANLGDRAKDTITGCTGIVVAKTYWLNGCVRITIQPETLKDGTPIPNETFDQQQVKVLELSAFKAQEQTVDAADAPVAPRAGRPGGPRNDPGHGMDSPRA